MGDRTAFFYGTLMAPGVLYRVIYGSATPEAWQKSLTTFKPAILPSFRRHRVRDAQYPGIVPHETSTVRGSYVTGLTEGDIFRLDIFEGSQYTREKVKVKILNDKLSLDQKVDEQTLHEAIVGEEEAETYVWIEGAQYLEDQEWDFEEFKREKMSAWMGVVSHPDMEEDEGFADVDKAVAQEENRIDGLKRDGSGGRINGKIIRDLENAAV